MARNTLKSFPTAMLRRGLASFHPGSSTVVARATDPPGTQPVQQAPIAPRAPITLEPAPKRPTTPQPETLEEVALAA